LRCVFLAKKSRPYRSALNFTALYISARYSRRLPCVPLCFAASAVRFQAYG